MNQPPIVSVVIPCFDHELNLACAVESVLAQSNHEWELIVVDDGSPGDVTAALRQYLSSPRVRLFHKPNGGPSSARNLGFDMSSSDSRYLLFLDADDVLEPTMIDALLAEIEGRDEVGMVFCDRLLIDDTGRPIPAYRDDFIRRYVPSGSGVRLLGRDEADTSFESIFGYSIAVPSCTLLRRSAYVVAGGWDERLGPSDDTDLWLRIALRHRVRYLPRRLVRRRLHLRSLTRSPAAEQRRRAVTRLFEQKWGAADWLTDGQREAVARARRFRDRRLRPYLWLTWARDRLRQREYVEAAKCCLRAAWTFSRAWT